MLLRAEEKPAAGTAAGLARSCGSCPTLRASIGPGRRRRREQATTLIFEKVIATSDASAQRDRTAPRLGSTGAAHRRRRRSRDRASTRSRAAARGRRRISSSALAQLVGSGRAQRDAPRRGDASRPATACSSIAARSSCSPGRTDWPPGAARDAVRAARRSGVDEGASRHALDRCADRGADVFAARRAGAACGRRARRLLFVANDPALLAAVLDADVEDAAAALEGTFAAGFRHALERGSVRQRDAVRRERGAPATENREPLFFSENLASLSDTLVTRRLERPSSCATAAPRSSQTVTYTGWSR